MAPGPQGRAEDGGVDLAARVVALGRLRPVPLESLVLECSGSPAPRAPAPRPRGSPQGRFGGALAGSSPGSSCGSGGEVEGDLEVQDFDSDGLSPAPVAGPHDGRRRMQLRAQQCMVCMDEKEHTFVPAHRRESPRHLQGHRFCSDCWVEFLQHRLRQHFSKQAVGKSAPLTCPVCRDEILVPDFLAVECDLPSPWQGSLRVRRQAVEVPSEAVEEGCIAGGSRPSTPGWCAAPLPQPWPHETLAPAPGPRAAASSEPPPDADEELSEYELVTGPGCRALWVATVRCFRGLLAVADTGGAPLAARGGYLQC